jgi:probable F420-dependent oxidoreductase
MKFSISIAMAEAGHYVPIAKAAEELGYDAIVLPDSIFYSERVSAPYPYTTDGKRMWGAETPWLDPFVAAAAMSAATTSIRFMTSVLKLAVRNPVLVAKQVGSIAAISDDRFTLGAGLGWLPEEFEWCGERFETRGKRMDEALEIVRAILEGGMVEYHGQHYSFEKLTMSPAPKKRVPFIIGGHTVPGLRRAARYEGWTSAMLKKKDLLELVAKLKVYRRELGKENEPFEIQAVLTDVFDADGFKALEEHGVTDVICVPWLMYGTSMTSPDLSAKIEGMKRYYDQIVAKAR